MSRDMSSGKRSQLLSQCAFRQESLSEAVMDDGSMQTWQQVSCHSNSPFGIEEESVKSPRTGY
jgi:hypothetical protein